MNINALTVLFPLTFFKSDKRQLLYREETWLESLL
jgi:hypothetical protein